MGMAEPKAKKAKVDAEPKAVLYVSVLLMPISTGLHKPSRSDFATGCTRITGPFRLQGGTLAVSCTCPSETSQERNDTRRCHHCDKNSSAGDPPANQHVETCVSSCVTIMRAYTRCISYQAQGRTCTIGGQEGSLLCYNDLLPFTAVLNKVNTRDTNSENRAQCLLYSWVGATAPGMCFTISESPVQTNTGLLTLRLTIILIVVRITDQKQMQQRT